MPGADLFLKLCGGFGTVLERFGFFLFLGMKGDAYGGFKERNIVTTQMPSDRRGRLAEGVDGLQARPGGLGGTPLPPQPPDQAVWDDPEADNKQGCLASV